MLHLDSKSKNFELEKRSRELGSIKILLATLPKCLFTRKYNNFSIINKSKCLGQNPLLFHCTRLSVQPILRHFRII